MMPANVSIIGGESLIGRELRELFAETKAPAHMRLLGVDEGSATLTEQGGEAVVITPLDVENLADSAVVFLAGSPASTRKVLGLGGDSAPRPALIDLTYAAEDAPAARLRAPMVEPAGFEPPAGALHVIAHPAAIALALFLTRVCRSHPVRRSTILVFEPASERGQRGLDELQKQTVNLLSFRTLPKDVYDAQLSFNVLASYGSEAPEALEAIELRVERHLTTLLGGRAGLPIPSIRLIQAPVFHGYSISAHVEFEEKPDVASIVSSLASPSVDVRDGGQESPSNAGIAGQDGIAVGSIATDRNNPMACWFWIVADNFRLMARNALAVALPLLPGGEAAG